MGSEDSPVHIVTVADDDQGDDDVSIVYAAPNPSRICLSQRKLIRTNKNPTVMASAASVFPQSSKRTRKRSFIDLSHEIERPDRKIDDVQILDSFTVKHQKPFSISNFEPAQSSDSQIDLFVCEICADSKPYGSFFPIEGCTHAYCSDCIQNYVVSKLENNITQIRCPDSGCNGLLEPEDCRPILTPQVFDRWGAALSEAVILESLKFYCPYKDCSGLLINDTGEIIRQSECPNCRRLFCARCNVPWHEGIECGEFQSLNKDEREKEDIMLMQLAKNKKWIRCPKCRFYVEKSVGCLFILCRCGYSFCYNCGAQLTSHHCTTCKR